MGAVPIKMILYVLAVVFFLLAGFGVPRWGWQWFGCACVVLAFLA